jgi:hypothetical protein
MQDEKYKNTEGQSEVKLERLVMQLLFIRVEYDIDRGWIIEFPKVYKEGIEYETEATFEKKKEAVMLAKKIYKNTKLPIIIYNKNNSYYKIISKVV